MKQSLQRDHFQAFSNMEETRPWSSYGCFFFSPLSLSLYFCLFHSFTEDQTLLSQASRDLKLIFSPLLMNAKIYSSCDLKERILYCSFH